MSYQSADTKDRVIDVLWKLLTHRGANVVIALAVMTIGGSEALEIRNGFDVPDDDACTHGVSLLTAVPKSMPI